MTRDTSVTISPQDIAAVEFKCASCKARLIVGLPEYTGILPYCPFCRAAWRRDPMRSVDRTIDTMIDSLRKYTELTNGKNLDTGYSARFQLSPEAEGGTR
jgi:hypothetical protein